MEDFVFRNPTETIFGRGKETEIGKAMASHGIRKLILLYGGGSVRRSGLYDRVVGSLRGAGLEWVEYGGIRSNPRTRDVDAAAEVARTAGAEAVLAVGGGSVLDSGKGVAIASRAGCPVWDFYRGRKIESALPLYTIVTLAATASENNAGFVLTDEASGRKLGMSSPHTFPRLSIMNPELTFSVPPTYTAYGAIDAVAHVLETYLTVTNVTPLMDRLAEGIVRTVVEVSAAVLERPEDYDARAELMLSASLALNGTTRKGIRGGDSPNHMIEHGLSAVTDVAHGAGLAIIMPAWMRWYQRRNLRKFELLAREVFGKDDALAGIEALEAWFASLHVPSRFSEAGIRPEVFPAVAEAALDQARRWRIDGLYTPGVITEILELAR